MLFAKTPSRGIIYQRKLSYETDRTSSWNCTYTFRQHGQCACRWRLRVLAVLAGGIRNNCHSQHSSGSFFSNLRLCAAALPLRLRVPAAAASRQPCAIPSNSTTRDQLADYINFRAGFALGSQLTWRRPLGSRFGSLQLRPRRPNEGDSQHHPPGHDPTRDTEPVGGRCCGLHGHAVGEVPRRHWNQGPNFRPLSRTDTTPTGEVNSSFDSAYPQQTEARQDESNSRFVCRRNTLLASFSANA
jgi:hypothetical protein